MSAWPSPAAPRPLYQRPLAAGVVPPQASQPRYYPRIGAVAISIVCIYLWFTYSRMAEWVSFILEAPVPLAQVMSVIILGLALLHFGPALRTLQSPFSVLLIGYTGWLACTIVTATWRGGAYEVFTTFWLRSLFVFYAVACFLHTTDHVRKAFVAFVVGILTIALLAFRFGRLVEGRVAMAGTLGNSNEYAVHLLLILPICLLFAAQSGSPLWLRTVSVVMSLWILLQALRSGSRTALLTMATLGVLGLILLPGAKKVLLVAVCLMTLIGGLLFLPGELISRYSTLFTGTNEISSADEGFDVDTMASAEASSNERRRLFWLTLRIAAQNPIFGVGPGNFTSEATHRSEGTTERVFWRAAHTVYGQIAAETGFVGLGLYLTIAFYSMRVVWRVRRWTAHRADALMLHGFATAWFCAQCSYAVSSTFGTSTYSFYIPLFAAVSCGLERAARLLPASPTAGPTPSPGWTPPPALRIQGQ